MVHQLFYVSSANSDNVTDAMVNEIIKKALVNNLALDITGILLFKKGMFAQLLEGPKANVEALFDKIQKDKRHSNIINFFKIDGNERIFPKWRMGFKEIGDLELKMINEILSWNKLISQAEKIDNNLILTMLKRFQDK
jgi:hypothetical protein